MVEPMRRRGRAAIPRDPMAAERSEPIITAVRPQVRHLPSYPNSRQPNVDTLCGKRGFFWRPGRNQTMEDIPNYLPLCSQCQRSSLRQTIGWRKMMAQGSQL